jgi:nucleoside phosphorylase/SAM-dependent methyltransferase
VSETHDNCDVLILIPKRDELRSAAAVFGIDAETPELMLGKYECWTTLVANLRVRLVLANTQGNANVALVTSTALAAFDPAVAFCIGTAAGREGEISYLDVVLATAVLDATEWRAKPGELRPQWDDKLKPTPDVEHDIDLFVKSNSWRAEARRCLVDALTTLQQDAGPLASWPAVQDAWTATTGFLQQDPQLLGQIWSLHAKLRAVDMETAGFVNACMSRARVRPWIVVRAVSDYGTQESKKEGARPAAGAAAAAVAYSFIAHGLRRAHPLLVAAPPAASAISDENFFARLTISDFLAEEVPKQFGIPFNYASVSRDLTIYDLAALCGSSEETATILNGMRERYFTLKYSEYDDEADVRRLTGSAWAEEVMDIYEHLGIRLSNADILYVGVGNGRDLPQVCPKFNSLTGADLSEQMLKQAAQVQPQLTQAHDSAETLTSIADDSVDLYLSLRAYQSSLFDIPSALRQLYRVLRTNGSFVISIPGGFLDRSGDELRYVPGLLVPGSSEIVDRARPRGFIQEILKHLDKMTFTRVGFHQRDGDLYVYGRKA